MPEQPSNNVIRRIQSLLALGSRVEDNEQEAAAAMAMAQKLLAQYNLDYHTVEQANVGGTKQVEEARVENMAAASAMYRWQRELWKAIADANFCWHWVAKKHVAHKRKKKMVWADRHMLLGRESNVMAVLIMGNYLCETIERLLPYPNSERLSRSAISWREGCADRLAERISEQAEASRKVDPQQGSSTAITLHDVAKREYAANYDKRYGAGSYAKRLEWEAGSTERVRKWEEEQAARQAKQEAEWLEYLQNETPEQKKKREREEEKQRIKDARASEREAERSARRWEREHYKEATRLDRSAYRAGNSAGADISLSKQAGAGKATPALKGGE
jgi:hypothetical protein